MLIDLISMVAAGFAIAGCVLIASHLSRLLTGRKLPRWVLPAAIGAAMIAFSVWNEYSWYPRVKAALPASTEVVLPVGESAFWRPWTYLWPITTRFIAVDTAALGHSAANADLVRADAIVVQRWAKTQTVPMVFDCRQGRRADLVEGASLAQDGTVRGAVWIDLPPEDPMKTAVCRGG